MIYLKNKYLIQGATTVIYLSYKGSYKECLVDTEDLAKIDIPGTWSYKLGNHGKLYASYKVTGKHMHKLICECPIGMVVDHINGNSLDNRKSNLRSVTQRENTLNRAKIQSNNKSGIPSVFWSNNKWATQVKINGKVHSLGAYHDKYEAGRVVNRFKMQHLPERVYRVPIKLG